MSAIAGSAQDSFRALLREVAPALRESGFRGSGSTYRVVESGNHGLVHFQKSTASNHELVRFTINLAIAVGDYWQLASPWEPPAVPSEAYCTVRMRVGHLLPARQDTWWPVPGVSAEEIIPILRDVAIPWVKDHVRDDVLARHFAAGAEGTRIPEVALLLRLGRRAEAEELHARLDAELVAEGSGHGRTLLRQVWELFAR